MGERLNIEWTAIYKTDKDEIAELSQFEDGEENLFGDIDQDRLGIFVLEHKDGRYWEVDLNDGSFRINGERFYWEGFDDAEFRLIYFRRVQREMGMFQGQPKEIGLPRTVHHVGWQTTIDGKNYQRVMAITENGTCSIKSK